MTIQRPDRGAARGELDTEERVFQSASRHLIGGFFVLLKVALVHKMDNRAVGPALNRFRVTLSEFHRKCDQVAAIQFVGDGIYINKRLIRADLETWEKARFVGDFFDRLSIAEVSFDEKITEQSIRDFVSHARAAVLDPEDAEALQDQTFSGIACRDLAAEGVARSDDAAILPDPIRVVRAFGIIVVTLRHYLEEVAQGASPPLLPLRRAVQEFVRLPARTPSLQLGVLALDQYRDELAGRQTRVGVIVVMMGKRLNLGVSDLREIGVASILAGVGRTLSRDLTHASVEDCAGQELFLRGARALATSPDASRAAALRLIAAAELGRLREWGHGHPLSRVLAVAEAFEHLTTPPPAGPGLQPAAAHQRILDSQSYDQAAARLLVATLGLFPVGSLVKLSTGESAIIVEGPGDAPELSQPQVMVVTDSQGRPTHRRLLTLSGSGISILGTVDTAKLDLNVGHFLFS